VKSVLRWAGWLIAILVAGYFVWFVLRTFQAQDLTALTTGPMAVAILLAACLYALIIPISAAAWAVLLQSQGETWPVFRLSTIMAVTQLAKYVPGNVLQHVSRAAMSMRQGMKLRSFTASVIHESVLAIAASVAVGLCLLWLSPTGLGRIPAIYRNVVIGGVLAATASMLILSSGVALLPERLRTQRWISPVLRTMGPLPGINSTLIAFSAYCLNYLIIGVGIWAIGQVLGLAAGGTYALLTGAFSLAWLLGFVVPGAPAGLGVREGVMALLLADAIPQHQILALVLAVRLATTAGDGICFGAGLWCLHQANREGAT
jgi:uncharacterized membrane protein YbhN (UPF0104 family)